MPLVFAAITPHPPLLIPSIGKEMLKKVEKTKKALLALEESLYASKPDVVLIVSPHGTFFNDAFALNFAARYESDFTDFGDLSTKLEFASSHSFAGLLGQELNKLPLPIKHITVSVLDHGVCVPLSFLLNHLKKTPILPISFSGLDLKTHLEFGTALQDIIHNSNLRVAFVASGDLSHALTTDAPAGFNQAGAEFDEQLQNYLATRNTTGILNWKSQFIDDAAECGLRSIMILLGLLRDTNYRFESLSYEAPFGVGYLTANFHI